MTAIDVGTEIGNARQALVERVGNVLVEKVPDAIEATKAVLPANEDLHQYAKAGMRHVQGAVDHLDIDLPRPFHKTARRSRWRQGMTFLALGICAGLVLNRILRSRRQGSTIEPSEFLNKRDQGLVAPYHTSVEEAGDERGVFHDRSDCPAGSRIKAENRVSGTAGRPKCKDCQSNAA
jgi:hypothetical protein